MQIINDLTFNRKKAIQNKKYLKKGFYILLPNLRTYAHISAYRYACATFPKQGTRLKFRLFQLFRPFFCFYTRKDSDFNGEILYFSNTNVHAKRDCKIFNRASKKMLLLCADADNYHHYLKVRQETSLFPVPILYEQNENQHCLIEEYIVSPRKTAEHSIENLFEFFLNYFRICEEQGLYYNSIDHSELIPPETDLQKCPRLYCQHGDLSIDNYICTEDKLIFFDFEHQNYFPPFYDLFFLIFNCAFAYEDYSLLAQLNAGKYDTYFIAFSHRTDGPLILLETCIRFLWHHRLHKYTGEKRIQVQSILEEAYQKSKERIINGSCHKRNRV